MSLKFRAEYGEPVLVHLEHDGKKYTLKINLQVLAITPAGQTNPNDNLPIFNVQAAPVMTVELKP